MTSKFITSVLFAALVFAIAACDNSDPEQILPASLQTTIVENLAADPATGRDPDTGQAIDTDRFTFFSLRNNEVVLSYDEADRSDSLSTNWDIAFNATTILVNGGTGRMGDGGAQILTAAFDDVTEAPADGYAQDNGTEYAIPANSGDGWYNYDPATFIVSPIPGRVLIVRTADGHYAKMRILSYYEGAPEAPDAFVDADRYYTFEFVFQPDGTRSFE